MLNMYVYIYTYTYTAKHLWLSKGVPASAPERDISSPGDRPLPWQAAVVDSRSSEHGSMSEPSSRNCLVTSGACHSKMRNITRFPVERTS